MRTAQTAIRDIHHALRGVEGIRLQPLVALDSGKTCGHEVLTLLAPDVEAEAFFRTLPAEACLQLFFRQLEVVRQLDEPGFFFINLPVRVLSDPDCLRRLLRVRACYRHNVVTEVQDPDVLLAADAALKRRLKSHVHRLRFRGWSVWLDDLTTGIREAIRDDGFWFDGVKTDRHEMAGHRLSQLVCDAREMGRMVLVEGIENASDLSRARDSGAEWGQGFLWPERSIRFRP